MVRCIAGKGHGRGEAGLLGDPLVSGSAGPDCDNHLVIIHRYEGLHDFSFKEDASVEPVGSTVTSFFEITIATKKGKAERNDRRNSSELISQKPAELYSTELNCLFSG